MLSTQNWVKSLLKKMNIGKYSTDEVRIGTWIDGKPLYRKVVEFTTPASGKTITLIAYDDSTQLNLISASGYFDEDTSTQYRWILPQYTGSSNYGRFYQNNVGIIFAVSGSTWGSKPAVAILEYTKTTD